MNNLSKTSQVSQQISTGEEFYQALDERLSKLGISVERDKPSENTNQYEVRFLPFQNRNKQQNQNSNNQSQNQ